MVHVHLITLGISFYYENEKLFERWARCVWETAKLTDPSVLLCKEKRSHDVMGLYVN